MFPLLGAWVKSLAGELRSHIAVLHGKKTEKKNKSSANGLVGAGGCNT